MFMPGGSIVFRAGGKVKEMWRDGNEQFPLSGLALIVRCYVILRVFSQFSLLPNRTLLPEQILLLRCGRISVNFRNPVYLHHIWVEPSGLTVDITPVYVQETFFILSFQKGSTFQNSVFRSSFADKSHCKLGMFSPPPEIEVSLAKS